MKKEYIRKYLSAHDVRVLEYPNGEVCCTYSNVRKVFKSLNAAYNHYLFLFKKYEW